MFSIPCRFVKREAMCHHIPAHFPPALSNLDSRTCSSEWDQEILFTSSMTIRRQNSFWDRQLTFWWLMGSAITIKNTRSNTQICIYVSTLSIYTHTTVFRKSAYILVKESRCLMTKHHNLRPRKWEKWKGKVPSRGKTGTALVETNDEMQVIFFIYMPKSRQVIENYTNWSPTLQLQCRF